MSCWEQGPQTCSRCSKGLPVSLPSVCRGKTPTRGETASPRSHSEGSHPPEPCRLHPPSRFSIREELFAKMLCFTKNSPSFSESQVPGASKCHSICKNLNYKDAASMCFLCRQSRSQLVEDQTFQLSLNSGCSRHKSLQNAGPNSRLYFSLPAFA